MSPTTRRSPASRPGAIAISGVFGFSPDGRYLATTHYPGGALTVWDVDRAHSRPERPGPRIVGRAAKFSPDSRRIAVGHQGWRAPRVRSGDRPAQPIAGACRRRRGIWLSVPMGPRSRSSLTMNRKTPSAGFLRWRLAGSSGRSRCRSGGTTSPGAPTAPRWRSPCDDSKIYLWDAATGTRKATLEGSTNIGIHTAFHPAGTLLASNGWEGRLRLWDPVLGRPWLSVTSGSASLEFSQDGRIVLRSEDKLTTYQVDPALEYRTFAHASSQPIRLCDRAVDPA